jgi:hypothetical protein
MRCVRMVPPLHAVGVMIEAREQGYRTLVVSPRKRNLAPKRYLVVRSPLEMIAMLQEDRSRIETVILSGSFAENPELASFLTECYPALRILSGADEDEEPDTYLPAFA